MRKTRREFMTRLSNCAGAAAFLATPRRASACLYGTWYLWCPNPNCPAIDEVEEGTCQHKCETCGTQMFYGEGGRNVTVVCPDGHANPIRTGTRDAPSTSYNCTQCGKECCRD
jgi:hypothetical protein